MTEEQLNEDLKRHALSFFRWVEENCTKYYIDRYFFDDTIEEYKVGNDFSVEELYEIFIQDK